MKKFIAALSVVCMLCGCVGSTVKNDSPELVPLMPAPEFDVESVTGGRLASSDLKGKVVLIDFWATYCAPCKTEVPHLNDMLARLKDKGVAIVGMTFQSGDADDVRPYIQDWGIQYPLAMGTDDVESGFGGFLGLPTTFLVGKDWKVYRKILGTRPGKLEQLEADINQLLAME
ncbi:MAG: TlpA family protein disulfide reductase [Acidobacteria bacterium]|nr:TlpA family protein disulfide reductase [Acidobacteriota bacterium]